jgi:hypothetical protein
MADIVSRLRWVNILAFAIPAVLLVWIDRRARRKPGSR